MFLKTKEKKIKTIMVLEVVVLLVCILMILLTNQRKVLGKIGKLFNENETKKTGEAINNGTRTQTLSIENWDLEKVDIVYDKDNVPVPVPKGYVASSVENGMTPIGQEILEENRVNTGFVIYEMTAEEIKNGTEVSITKNNFWEESQKRNQWVWVPVADPSRIYERDNSTGKAKAKLWSFSTTGRTQITSSSNIEPGVLTNADYDNEKIFAMYDMQGMTKAKLLEELEQEYEATMESIEKYGGFYIGRYETGNVGAGTWDNHNTPRQPIVQRMNTNINYVTWYDAYNNIKNTQRNENVKSNIIWGSLWDETLQWLVDSESKSYEEIKKPVGWGNHHDSEFNYINASGAIVHKNANNGTRVPTGSSEQNKANNIYDMAGNVWEWTLEAGGADDHWYRGGYCQYEASPCSVDYRSDNDPVGNGARGVRAYFYIK